jgi:hypothetical protein
MMVLSPLPQEPRRDRVSRGCRAICLGTALAVVSGCGTIVAGARSTINPSTPPRSNLPPAGIGSPDAAVSGFLRGLITDSASLTCSYVPAAEESTCRLRFPTFWQITDPSLGETATKGTLALVVILTTAACNPGTSTCLSNANKDDGLPDRLTPLGWDSTRPFANSASVYVPCIRIGKRWFVQVFSGDFASTGATGVIGTTGSGSSGTTGSTGVVTTSTALTRVLAPLWVYVDPAATPSELTAIRASLSASADSDITSCRYLARGLTTAHTPPVFVCRIHKAGEPSLARRLRQLPGVAEVSP